MKLGPSKTHSLNGTAGQSRRVCGGRNQVLSRLKELTSYLSTDQTQESWHLAGNTGQQVVHVDVGGGSQNQFTRVMWGLN